MPTDPRDEHAYDATIVGLTHPPTPAPGSTPGVAHACTPAPVPQLLAGRYELLGLLGAGGMGTVYKARDRELDELVALKVLRRELVDAPGMLERFRAEVRLARKVTHRNVARTFDIGEHAGEKFLTMEYVAGESLAARIARIGRLPVAEIVHVATEVCAGLAAAHAAGVLHRDLKPDNVLLATGARVMVTDFGVARALLGHAGAHGEHLTAGGIVGTPAYMAPEQVEAREDIDARADIYALGVMLYEMAIGRCPWEGETAFAVAYARLVADAPPDPRAVRPELPAALARLIQRCMARDRVDRYASATHVAGEVVAIGAAAGESFDAARPPPPPARGSVAPSMGADPLARHAAAAASQPGARVVAVLPFRNAGPPDDAHLADGLTDDLIDGLTSNRALRVRPRGAVARYREGAGERDPRELGRELDVQVVVEGTVRRTGGGGVRVTVRLVSVADGFQLWAQRFDRAMSELLVVSDELARAVAQALATTGDVAGPRRAAATDPEALELYLRGLHAMRHPWLAHARRASELLGLAARRAPDDPTILAGYAVALSRLLFFGSESTPEIEREAARVAERAVELAPEQGEGHYALAAVAFQRADLGAMARHVRAALARTPGLADAHMLVGRVLVECGHDADGGAHLAHAFALDPGMPLLPVEIARLHALRGEWDAADAVVAREEGGFDGMRARIYRSRTAIWRRDTARAAAVLASMAAPIAREEMLVAGLAALAVTGRIDPLHMAIFEEFASLATAGWRLRSFFGQITTELRAFAGETDLAMLGLLQCDGLGLIDVFWLDRCPTLAPLRARADFAAVRARVAERAARAASALLEGEPHATAR